MQLDSVPFYVGSAISDPLYFIGDRDKLDFITNRAISAQPTSINLVGEKRIGKSSLLINFLQTYESRIQSRDKNPRNYLVIYLSLQQGNCHSKSGFYRVIAEELVKNLEQRSDWFRKPRKLIQALQRNSFDTASFYDAMRNFRDLDILPILCLDNIETLFHYSEEFDNGFYDNLRSLMQHNALMLVIASEASIQVYSSQKKLTSSFFNDALIETLEGFTDNEARDLVDYLNKKHPQNALKIKAEPEDVETIIPQALVTGGHYFNELWNITLNSDERQSIRNLLQETSPTTKDRKIWHKLIDKEILVLLEFPW